jgi:hypothetical protein
MQNRSTGQPQEPTEMGSIGRRMGAPDHDIRLYMFECGTLKCHELYD